MKLAKVMDELGDALDNIGGLRVYRYPPDNIQPPAAVVAYPDSLTFDETYGRGMDSMVVPVVVIVGKVSDRASRNRLSRYCDGAGSESIKATLDGHEYTACDSVTVATAEFDVIDMAGVDYISAVFDVAIAGTGTT